MENEPEGPIPHNVFEANALKNMGEQTVPLTFNGKVVGQAFVKYDEVGVRVTSTHISDENLIEMLKIDIGPAHIHYHEGSD